MEPHATALLVADDTITVDVLRTALANEPIAFDVAYDLATAISCLDSGRYGGAIVDLGLPQGGGFDVLRHVSSRGVALPMVVIAKRSIPESVRSLLAREHVKLVLSKPVETALLLNVLRGLCGLESAKEVSRPRREHRPAAPDELREPDLLWRRL